MSALEDDEPKFTVVPEDEVPGTGMSSEESLALLSTPVTDVEDVHPALLAAGETMEDDIVLDDENGATWEGPLIVEGLESGDGRMFSPGALTWPDPAQVTMPLMMQLKTAEGHGDSVTAGRITEIWRDGARIMGRGIFDINGTHGREAFRLVEEKFLTGVSGDVDSVKDADIELVFPEEGRPVDDTGEEMPDELMSIFGANPELTIFHKGRLRGATLVQFPAFVEAYITLTHGVESMAASGVGYAMESPQHMSATSDGPWDGPANDKRFRSVPLSLDTARQAFAHVTEKTQHFLHHEVDENGNPGPANLTACASGIAVLNTGSHAFTLSDTDRVAVYNHLATHLRDAGQVPTPFEEVQVDATLTASVDYPAPPSEWFADPKLTEPTPLTVTDDGRVFGHAATWGTCHTGFGNSCVRPPREGEHSYFRLGELKTSDGEFIGVGQITLGTGHAPVFGIDAQAAAAHYDNTGSAIADVTSGEDDHGIWVAGAVRSGTPVARVQELRAAKISGDWRRIGGKLRLVAMLAVNVPGFPIPRTRTHAVEGQQLSLVAAGLMHDAVAPDRNKEALKNMAAKLQREMGRDVASRAAALRASVLGGE